MRINTTSNGCYDCSCKYDAETYFLLYNHSHQHYGVFKRGHSASNAVLYLQQLIVLWVGALAQ